MRATKCRERGTLKKRSKKLFGTRNIMDGVWKLAVVMHGVEFIAQTTIKIAAVGNSAFQVFGVHQQAHQITAGRFDGLSAIVLPGRTVE